MVRKPQVTRTFKTSVFTLLCVNTGTRETETVDVTLLRPPKERG